MFTGLVEGVGEIASAEDGPEGRVFGIEAPFAGELVVGQSVAIDGACLTVTGVEGSRFQVTAIQATLERTVAGRYRTGTPVNLERAMRVGDRLDGHIVQGHVDGLGHYLGQDGEAEGLRLRFRLPRSVSRVTIPQGSVTLSGISLTVVSLEDEDVCTVAIVPHTWSHTNLSALTPGDPVNVEGDVIGKYVLRALGSRAAIAGSGSHHGAP